MFPCEFCELFKNTYFLEDLQTAGPETPELRYLFNKVASLTAWSSLVVLERDCSTGISLRIFRKTFLQNTYHPHLIWCCFSFLQISEVYNLKSIYLVEQWQIRRRNSKAHSVRCSYGNHMETSLSSCGHTYTDLGFGSERKGRTEKLVKVG